MRIRRSLVALVLFWMILFTQLQASDQPNIVIILTDDQGYADVSYNPHSPPEVSTPNIDALAQSSTICTQGYTSGHVCSPTRAGLMTGRYQQRFGIYTAGEGGSGVPLDEVFYSSASQTCWIRFRSSGEMASRAHRRVSCHASRVR